MNVRLTLVTTAAAVLLAASLAGAQTSNPTAPTPPVTAWAAVPAHVAPVPPVASASAVTAAEAPQAAPTPQPVPKVVKPAAASPKVTLTTVGEDPQAPPAPPAPPVPPVPPAPPAPPAPQLAPKAEMPKVQATRMVKGQLINLRLEFTITDQVGTATPVKKTVTMNVADGESGRIRTNADVYRTNNKSFTSVPLSIDASPEVEGGKVRLRASLEYQLLNDAASADVPSGKTSITQAVTSILSDGVPAILCQSADPLTDRRVTLEVKATIVK